MAVTLQQILAWTEGEWVNRDRLKAHPNDILVTGPQVLEKSREGDVAYFFAKEYQKELPTARPSVLITGQAFVEPLRASGLPLWNSSAVIACANPYLAMALVSEHFVKAGSVLGHFPDVPGLKMKPTQTEVHPSSWVHPEAQLEEGVKVGPFCVVDAGARIGKRTHLMGHCTVGINTQIGADGVLFAGVRIYEGVQIGDRVRIHSNSVIGADGFGYAQEFKEGIPQRHVKIHHLGGVVIGNDVEIGALTSIDRGTIGNTTIGDQAKIDNQVQLGHNSVVESGAIICGGTALAGRAEVGKFAFVAGIAGIANNVRVGDGAKVAAATLVSKDVPPGGTAVGNPQREHSHHFRIHAYLNKILKRKE